MKKNKQHSLHKVRRKNKAYSIKDCALYKLKSITQLEQRLFASRLELESVSDDSSFNVFNLEKKGKVRVIQAPNYKLHVIHSRIASLIARVTTPNFLHSGVPGRSNITNARTHIGSHELVTLDIQSFFPSVSQSKIYNFFKNDLDMASDLSGILANLICYKGKLSTGSSLSMLLSYWVNNKLFSDIDEYCLKNGINFTLYVDDITLSGDIKKDTLDNVKRLIKDKGYKVHPKKTRRYSKESPKLVTGVVIHNNELKVRNEHLKSIYSDLLMLNETASEKEYDSILAKTLGKLNAAGQIDQKYKQKAKSMS